MFLYALSFLAGTAQLLWLPVISLNWLPACLVLIVICAIYRNQQSKYRKVVSAAIVFLIGFSYAIVVAHSQKSHQLNKQLNEPVEVKGHVVELPTITAKKTKFILEVENTTPKLPVKRLIINWYDPEQKIKPGQTWQLKVKLKPIHALYNPASFDYSKWLFRQGIDATATVKEANLLNDSHHSLFSKINNVRLEIAAILHENIKSQRVVSLLTALVIGDKSLISHQDSQLFQTTGTAHLIAISGLHIGLIAFVGLLIGRLVFNLFVSQRTNRFLFEAVFSITFALSYALLAGLSTPTIRALVMVVVFALSYALKSQVSRWQAWSFALIIVLLLDPLNVLDAGFWFSFVAVAVLMFAFTGKVFEKSKILGFIKAQMVILIGLMPLMIVVFHQFNLLTPFANFLVLPLASIIIIPLLFLSLFIYVFSEYLAHYLFLVVEKATEIMFYILDYLQQMSFLNINLPTYNSFYIIVFVIVAAILLLPNLFRWKPIVLLLLIPLFMKTDNGLNEKDFIVRVLDVGQGLSLIIQTQKHVMIYDTGAKFESGFSMAKAVVIPLLQSLGIKKVDKLILSHGDNDHAGGAAELIAKFNPQVYGVTGDYTNCKYPFSWQWDGVQFQVLSPFEVVPYFGNNTSCVIKVSSENGSILLTADIGEPVEYRLISQLSKSIDVDVLVVPHHGSLSSSSENFIKAVNPKYAINSSGYGNQFNHPHKKVKKRYESKGIEFIDTQSSGMIEIVFINQQLKINQYTHSYTHFWRSLINTRN